MSRPREPKQIGVLLKSEEDPLDSLCELRDDLAHDEDRSFVNTANEVIDQWSTERAQHAAALASRDARIEELEEIIDGIEPEDARKFWEDVESERDAAREQFRRLRHEVNQIHLSGDVGLNLKGTLDRFPPIDEAGVPLKPESER